MDSIPNLPAPARFIGAKRIDGTHQPPEDVVVITGPFPVPDNWTLPDGTRMQCLECGSRLLVMDVELMSDGSDSVCLCQLRFHGKENLSKNTSELEAEVHA